VQIVNLPANDGFAKACNAGAQLARGDILFFLNPDTLLSDSNLAELLAVFNDSSVGIAGPKLILPTGASQPWSAGNEINFWSLLKNNLKIIPNNSSCPTDTVSEVDWVSGAALAISKKVFNLLGDFDENFFMYFEDVDLCKKVKNQALSILALPSVQVIHLGGQSFLDSSLQKKYYYESQDYYFKKNLGRISLFFLILLRWFKLLFSKTSY